MQYHDALADVRAIKHAGDAFLAFDAQLKQAVTQGASVRHAQMAAKFLHHVREMQVTSQQPLGQIQNECLNGWRVINDVPCHGDDSNIFVIFCKSACPPYRVANLGGNTFMSSVSPQPSRQSLQNWRALRRRVRPFDTAPRRKNSLFEALAEAIVSQQLSLAAAATIYGRFEALFLPGRPEPEGVLALPEDRLKGVGLSQAKLLALRDLAAHTLAGTVPDDRAALRLTDEALIRRLTQVRGVGPWTVQMILMFRYGRLDVWPVDDLGVQKGFRLLFPELPFANARELLRLGDFYAGRRSELAWYCWRAIEEQQKQSLTAVPVQWQGQALRLWLQQGRPWQLDFSPNEPSPVLLWPGEYREQGAQSGRWQKQLEQALKRGPDWAQLQLRGTDFQQRVWQGIAAIPWGETRSYRDLAEDLGNVKAVRAVAQACGANFLPLFIPCHRVVGTNDLGGFGGGLPLKRVLLAAERA